MAIVLKDEEFEQEKDIRRQTLYCMYEDLKDLTPGSEDYSRQIEAISKVEREMAQEELNDKNAELKQTELKQSKWKSILDIVSKIFLGVIGVLVVIWQHNDAEKNLNARHYSAQMFEKDNVARSASSKSVQNEALRKTKEYRSIL